MCPLRVVLIAFALAVVPVWSTFACHPRPEVPTFGLPCPATIFTIGLLCIAATPTPRSPQIAPLLWVFVGSQAAFLFGVWPDMGLVAAARRWASDACSPRAGSQRTSTT